jgi:hypothetical protein
MSSRKHTGANQRKVSIERNVTFVPLQPIKLPEMMDEGEYSATEPIQNANGQNIVQYVPKIPEQPSAPPRTPPASPVPLPKPETPHITRTCQPPGYYCKLNNGEYTSSATAVTPKNVEHSSNHWALAAAEAEPTLHEALSGLDGLE